jgi:hypothetical protein
MDVDEIQPVAEVVDLDKIVSCDWCKMCWHVTENVVIHSDVLTGMNKNLSSLCPLHRLLIVGLARSYPEMFVDGAGHLVVNNHEVEWQWTEGGKPLEDVATFATLSVKLSFTQICDDQQLMVEESYGA